MNDEDKHKYLGLTQLAYYFVRSKGFIRRFETQYCIIPRPLTTSPPHHLITSSPPHFTTSPPHQVRGCASGAWLCVRCVSNSTFNCDTCVSPDTYALPTALSILESIQPTNKIVVTTSGFSGTMYL